MSLDIPPLPPMHQPPPRHPERVERFATDLLAVAATVSDVGVFVRTDAVIEGWRGQSATAYAESLPPRGVALSAMVNGLRFVVAGARRHAEHLRELERMDRDLAARHTRLRDLHSALVRDRSHAMFGGGELADRGAHLRAEIAAWSDDVLGVLRTERLVEDAMRSVFSAVDDEHDLERLSDAGVGPGDLVRLARSPLLDPFASDEDRRQWWAGLGELSQLALISANPGLITRRGGLPARARDLANRTQLRQDLLRLRSLQHPRAADRRLLRRLEALDRALLRAEGRRDPRTGALIPVQLWLYEPRAFEGDGRVAISIGDLDRADHLALQVPGLGNDLSDAGGLLDRMSDLHEASTSADDQSGTVAALTWVGYDAPDNLPPDGLDWLGVVSPELAQDGGEFLSQDLEDLLGSRSDDPHVSVIGHSYGSTTVAQAAAGAGLPGADETVLVGSPGPGPGITQASDLGQDPSHVWVGNDSLDPVSLTADNGAWSFGDPLGVYGHGADVAGEDFGGIRFGAESPHLGNTPSLGHHQNYFTPGSESLANIAEIVVGDHDDVHVSAPVHDGLLTPTWDPEWSR